MGEVSASCGPEHWVTEVRTLARRQSSPDLWVPQESTASASQLTSPGLKASVSQSLEERYGLYSHSATCSTCGLPLGHTTN